MNVDNRTLFIADNLDILRGIDSKSVDLIATDPPFNKGVKAFEGIVTAGIGKGGKQVSYKDTWTWSDVQDEWTQAIRQDHPEPTRRNPRGKRGGWGGYERIHLLACCAGVGDAPSVEAYG